MHNFGVPKREGLLPIRFSYLHRARVLSLVIVAMHIGDVQLATHSTNDDIDLLPMIVGQQCGLMLPHERLDRIGNDGTPNRHRPPTHDSERRLIRR